MMLNVFFLLFHALSYSANVEDEDNGYVVYTDMVDAKFPVHTKTKKGCEIYSLSMRPTVERLYLGRENSSLFMMIIIL